MPGHRDLRRCGCPGAVEELYRAERRRGVKVPGDQRHEGSTSDRAATATQINSPQGGCFPPPAPPEGGGGVATELVNRELGTGSGECSIPRSLFSVHRFFRLPPSPEGAVAWR